MARRKIVQDDDGTDDSTIVSFAVPEEDASTIRPSKTTAQPRSSLQIRPIQLAASRRPSVQQSARKQIRLAPIQSVSTQRTRFDLGPDVVVAEIPAPTRPKRTTMSPSKYLLASSPESSSSSESESDESTFDFSENPDSSSSISEATDVKPDDLTRQIRRKLFATPIKPRESAFADLTMISNTELLHNTTIQQDVTERTQPSWLHVRPLLAPVALSPTKDEEPAEPATPTQSPLRSKLVSPSKTKLMSPSKQSRVIPDGPRTSIDGFWSVERVNNWNDQHSPQKVIKSPKKLKMLLSDEPTSPTTSPQKNLSPSKRELHAARKDFESRKVAIAQDFFRELDERIADGQIAALAEATGGVQLNWSKTLNSTAGRANWRKETSKLRKSDGSTVVEYKHFASIELAEKVIDNETRLLNVIAHEFCHLANFMVLGIKDRPHGAEFKTWGKKVTAAFGDREVEVTTKHNYDIDYKYIWACTGEDCDLEFKRHSKSIDPAKHSCGTCKSKLVQIKPAPRKGSVGGKVVGYAAFVKEHFASIKKSMPDATHKEVMAAVGEKYRAEKAALADTTTTDVEQLANVLEAVALTETTVEA